MNKNDIDLFANLHLDLPIRHAARVLLLDQLGRVLLVRGHDEDNPQRSWWFTIGGGIEPGEGPREAALRELWEESGVRLEESDLRGPILERVDLFDFAVDPFYQHEYYFFATINGPVSLDRSGWTQNEVGFMDELAWLEPNELRSTKREVFPMGLATIVENLVAEGWDGTLSRIGLQ